MHPAIGTVTVERTGFLSAGQLMEASGLLASHARNGDFFVHNDDGEPELYAINQRGAHLHDTRSWKLTRLEASITRPQ